MFSEAHLARLEVCGKPKRVVSETLIPILDKDLCVCAHVLRQLCSDGSYQYILTETLEAEINAMGANYTTYKPTADNEVCRQGQITVFELSPGTYTEQAIIEAALADEALEFDFGGNAVAATFEDAYALSVHPKQCGEEAADGSEVIADWLELEGNRVPYYEDPEDGGIDLDQEIVVPATGCALVSICFKKCLDKEAIAALGG